MKVRKPVTSPGVTQKCNCTFTLEVQKAMAYDIMQKVPTLGYVVLNTESSNFGLQVYSNTESSNFGQHANVTFQCSTLGLACNKMNCSGPEK